MKSAFACVAAIALLAGVLAQDNLVLNTPNPPTQCVPTQITWSGGTGPYFMTIFPGGQPAAPALQQFPNLAASPLIWDVNISAGTSVGFSITDSTGTTDQTASVIIQSGPISSCLSSTQAGQTTGAGTSTGLSTSASTTGGSTPAGTTSTTGPSGATTSSSGTASGPSSGTPATSVPSSPGPSASTTGGSSSGALANVVPMGVAGIVGAVIAAIIA